MIIPIAIAVVCCIIWVALYQGRVEEITFFPYAYNYSTVNPPNWVKPKMFGIFPQHEMFSLLYFAIITSLSYQDFVKNFKGYTSNLLTDKIQRRKACSRIATFVGGNLKN
jgi:hypothetical protein